MNKGLIWMYFNLLGCNGRILEWCESTWKGVPTLGWRGKEWAEVHVIHNMMMDTIRNK